MKKHEKKLIEFQNAVAKMNKCAVKFARCDDKNKIEEPQDAYMNAQVLVVKLYNDILTLVQDSNLLD